MSARWAQNVRISYRPAVSWAWDGSADSHGQVGAEARKESEIVGDGRRPDVGREVVEPAPKTARQPIGALQTRDVGFYAGPEVAQFAIDPVALDHIHDAQAGFVVKGRVANATGSIANCAT